MAIWKIGRRTDGAVPALVELLKTDKRQEKKDTKESISVSRSINPPSKMAIWFLGEIGPEAKPAVPALIETLKKGDIRLRGPAAEALGKIGPDAKTAIPALAAVLAAHPTVAMILRDCDSSVIDLAGGALCKMGPNGVARILPLFDNESEKARELACQLISETGPSAKPYVSHLVAALRDKSPAVRRSAAEALGKLALDPRQSVPALAKKLDDPDGRVRAAACRALGGFHGSAAAAITPLTKALADSDSEVRASAAYSLGMIGGKAGAAAPALLKLIGDDGDAFGIDPSGCRFIQVGEYAVEALGDLGPAGKEAVPTLIELIRWRQENSPLAIRALGCMGPAAASAVPILIEALPEYPEAAQALVRIAPDNPRVKGALLKNFTGQAERVFARVGDRLCLARASRRYGPLPSSAVSAFAADLASPDNDRRVTTALAVLEVAPADARAMRVLADAFGQHLSGCAWDDEAAETLSHLGPRARPLIPALCEDLKDGDEVVRIRAAERLAALGRDAEPALPRLIDALNASDMKGQFRPMILRVLAGIGRPAVRPLVAALKHEDVRVRSGAAEALGEIGPNAAEAAPAMVGALKDPRPDVRAAAASALASVGAEETNAAAVLSPLLNDEYHLVRECARLALDKLLQQEYSR